MLYEVSSKRTIVDKNGADKVITENFIVTNCMLFGEAETAVLAMDVTADVVSVSRSNISDFANKRTNEDEKIYIVNIERYDDVLEKAAKVVVALFAIDLISATKIANDYVSKAIYDETIVGIKKSKFIDIIKYTA